MDSFPGVIVRHTKRPRQDDVPQESIAKTAWSQAVRPEPKRPFEKPVEKTVEKPVEKPKRTQQRPNTNLLLSLAKPSKARLIEWNRARLHSNLCKWVTLMAPGVKEHIYTEPSTMQNYVSNFRHFGNTFAGGNMTSVAAHIYSHLFIWSSKQLTMRFAPQSCLNTEQMMNPYHCKHPFIFVITGHHGTGKSALIQYITESIRWTDTQCVDFCDTTRPDVVSFFRKSCVQQAQYPDQISLTLFENAETTFSYFGIADALVDLCARQAKHTVYNDNVPFRLIILAESNASWLRTLVEKCDINVYHLLPLEERHVIEKFSWKYRLPESEGIPSRAICLEYVQVHGSTTDHLFSQLGSVSQFILRYKLDLSWWDTCETLLTQKSTALYYFRVTSVMRTDTRIIRQGDAVINTNPLRNILKHTLDEALWSLQKKNNSSAMAQLAMGFRIRLIDKEERIAQRDSYDASSSWYMRQYIRQAHANRMAKTGGRESFYYVPTLYKSQPLPDKIQKLHRESQKRVKSVSNWKSIH